MTVCGHSGFEITKRYLGITQDDLDAAYRKMQLFCARPDLRGRSGQKARNLV